MKKSLSGLVAAMVFIASGQESVAQAACNAAHWQTYKGDKLKRVPDGTAYFYLTSRMAIDADGAPNAYHPDNQGIDDNANAGYPRGGWRNVLVEDPRHPGKPCIQQAGPFQGYFVAKTTLADKTLPVTDTNRYVDSTAIPYIVFPGAFHAIRGTGTWGDVGMVKISTTERQRHLSLRTPVRSVRAWAKFRSGWRRTSEARR